MSERSEIEKVIVEALKSEGKEFTDPELKLIDEVIKDFAPEVAYLYQIREDKTEDQQTKTGYLHENRVLGVILKLYVEGKKKITTIGVENEYNKYFKTIARSTISSYLNNLIKDRILYKEKDGRKVTFYFSEDPPIGISPSWFTRIFCIIPVYFNRAIYFSFLYINAEKIVQQHIYDYGYTNKLEDNFIINFKYLVGLILLNIFKNRSSSCVLCQFSKREIYEEIEARIDAAIKDRSDVLPEELVKSLIIKYSEIAKFDGVNINDDTVKEEFILEMLKYADLHKKDLDFQRKVSLPRKNLRLKQIKALKEENVNLKD